MLYKTKSSMDHGPPTPPSPVEGGAVAAPPLVDPASLAVPTVVVVVAVAVLVTATAVPPAPAPTTAAAATAPGQEKGMTTSSSTGSAA